MSFDAIVLIAHGSRHESANADTRALVAELVQRGVCRFAVPAFLELAEPDIDTAGADCVQRGATSVLLLPHFLSAGVHVQRDLTAARKRLTARFPAVAFALAEPIGAHPSLLDALIERAKQAGTK